MADNKLIIGSISFLFAIVIATLLLSTSSSRCLQDPFWEPTNYEGIYYCNSTDNYRACESVSDTNKTCYHIKNATQIKVDFTGYDLKWDLIFDDPLVNSTIINAVDTEPIACSGAMLGAIYFDISEDDMCICRSTGWRTMESDAAC